MRMGDVLKVLIVRDRKCAGGGIHGYFDAIQAHLSCAYRFCDVGRPQGYYGAQAANGWLVSRMRTLCDWFHLGWEILRFRPGLVHLNAGLDREERSLNREAVSVRIAQLLGCPVLVSWHGWDHPAQGTANFPGGNQGWLCLSYRKAVGHIVLASRFREDLLRWGFQGPIHVETTVVSEEILKFPALERKPAETPILLFLSRIEQAKGLWELLDAYAILKQRVGSCRLVIAGNGPDLERLKSRVVELGLSDVSFPGFLGGEARLKCFREAAVFCLLSYTEGMPLAVLEAMAMGLPVVTSFAGGLGDILHDGENGFLIRMCENGPLGHRFDPLEVANRVERLVKSPEMSERIGDSNARYARVRFSPLAVSNRLDRIYRELLQASKPR